MIKTFFCVDKEKDAFQIWVRLRFFGEGEAERFSYDTGMDIAQAHYIAQSTEYNACSHSMEMFVEEVYKKNQSHFSIAKSRYPIEWEKISKVFYEKVESLTEVPWAFSEYRVILSAFHRGISNRDAKSVFRWIFDDPKEHPRITAHEILMIHLWEVFERVFGKQTVEENEEFFWGANEITTVAILGLEKDMDMLWSEEQKGFNRFLLNYPHLEILKEQLKERYIQKISFQEYMEGLYDFL